jgi:15-cis-phytoene synthase
MNERYWLRQDLYTSFEFARRITKVYAHSFYFSARFLPLERRWATYALYGFCRFADNLVDIPRSRNKAELLFELDYLQKEMELAYRTGDSAHPAIQPFIHVAQRYQIPLVYPLELLQGLRMDLEFQPYRTFDELYVFCYRVAGVVGLMMTYILGYKDRAAFAYAEKLGVAMQLTNILRDIQEDKNFGRIYLPGEDLERFRVTQDDLVSERWTPALQQLLDFQVQRAHGYYAQADEGIDLLLTESQFSIRAASRIYRGILYRLQQRDYNPFLGRIYVPPKDKLTILFNELMHGYVKKGLELLQERKA